MDWIGLKRRPNAKHGLVWIGLGKHLSDACDLAISAQNGGGVGGQRPRILGP